VFAQQRFVAIGIFFACLSACGGDTTQPAATNEDPSGLRGKQLYLDGGRMVGTGVSCVDCHGDVIGSAFALGKAANNPAAIDYAINAVPQMARSRVRYTAQDLQDLATFIGNPSTPSPDLRLETRGAAANSFSAERLDFGGQLASTTSATSTVRMVNVGQLGIRILGLPTITGTDSSQFELVASDCDSGLVLQTLQSCDISVNFRAAGTAGLRTASIYVAHDWIRGGVNVALIGTAVTTPSVIAP
jgi:hypothetical protein